MKPFAINQNAQYQVPNRKLASERNHTLMAKKKLQPLLGNRWHGAVRRQDNLLLSRSHATPILAVDVKQLVSRMALKRKKTGVF